MILQTENLDFINATENDIDEIISIESHIDNRDFLWIGTREEHLEEISDNDQIPVMIKERATNETAGYILARLNRKANSFELRRLAITKKGKGYGKETMLGLFDYVFNELKQNKLWLDVYHDNYIGISLYEKVRMHRDGILRENDLTDRGYMDQIIYSILKREYDNL